jgi:hypothetical protein
MKSPFYQNPTVEEAIKALETVDKGQWIVRKTVDESGDYPLPTYDILSIYPYGPSLIGSADSNPQAAILFSSSKLLAEKVKEQKIEIMSLRADLEAARQGRHED